MFSFYFFFPVKEAAYVTPCIQQCRGQPSDGVPPRSMIFLHPCPQHFPDDLKCIGSIVHSEPLYILHSEAEFQSKLEIFCWHAVGNRIQQLWEHMDILHPCYWMQLSCFYKIKLINIVLEL